MPSSFDTSALAKAYHAEAGSALVLEILSRPGTAYISGLALIEMESVLANKLKARTLSAEQAEGIRLRFREHIRRRTLTVVTVRLEHFRAAAELVRKHGSILGLRSLDAIQLAVAIDLARNGISDVFLTADQVLVQVATAEGLAVFNPALAL